VLTAARFPLLDGDYAPVSDSGSSCEVGPLKRRSSRIASTALPSGLVLSVGEQ